MIVLKPVTHPHKVTDSCLHSCHRRTEIRNRFAINFTLLMHDDQVRYLLSHRLQDALNGFGMEHRHCGIAQTVRSNWEKHGTTSRSHNPPGICFKDRTTLRPAHSPGFSPSCGNHEIPGSGHSSSTHRWLLIEAAAPPLSRSQRTTTQNQHFTTNQN